MKTKKLSRSTKPKETVSQAAHLLGKRSWKVRLERFGLKTLQAKMREVGKNATGRPRLPDDQVKPNSLYQRARRERLRAEKQSKSKKQKGAKP
jgi:hypothetical protein